MRKLTLKQIAKELNVSIATVSKALRDSKEISKETKEKIQAFAKFYNYKPNSIALSLLNKKTKNIGVIIPEIIHHFFATVISGIENIALKEGYNVIICVSNESFDKEVVNIDTLANGSIDGFIMSISKETQKREDYEHIQEAIDQGMPIVMFDRVVENVFCDKVIINDTEGSYKAVEHLINEGRRNIALITTPDYVSVGKLRTQGYINALKNYNYLLKEELIIKVENDEDIVKHVKHLFDHEEFDAVFAVNEIFAVSVMHEALERNIKIPEQLSVIGFTNGLLAQNSYPRLSTINQHGFEIGQESAKLLIDKLEERTEVDAYTTKIIKTTLVERASTKKI
ncbi:LacI family DNA-binding transcriptional regulator [Zhouia sp. PK063]|uniref:LacI family DNA-binding transcriptional regulator n=1 Tax=Zhouia sp. PK063 TaxID=3373602 RepID=UPI003794BB26